MPDTGQIHQMAAALEQERDEIRAQIDELRTRETELNRQVRALHEQIRTLQKENLKREGSTEPRIAR